MGENEEGRSQESEVRSQETGVSSQQLAVGKGRASRGQRTANYGPRKSAFESNIYLYDKYPGGVGFSEPLFRMSGTLLENTYRLIAGCPCPSGCPSCVGPAGEVGEKGKEVALAILKKLSVASGQ